MSLKLLQPGRSIKIENIVIIAALLFIFKFVFSSGENLIASIINEVLVIVGFYFLTIYFQEFIREKKYSPLFHVLIIGVLASIIFFILSILIPIFSSIFGGIINGNVIHTIVMLFYSFIIICILSYIFSVFRILYFSKQRRNLKFYFNTMVAFIFITSIHNTIVHFYPSTDYIQDAFMVVTILLISINSLRISWIAFLSKREKIYLLIISVVLSILFGINIGLSTKSEFSNLILMQFSPALQMFLVLMMIYGCVFFGIVFFTTLFHLPTAEAIDRKVQEVTSLIDMNRLMTQVFDIKELADTVTDITTQVCNSESAWLISELNGDNTINSVKNIGYVEAEKIIDNLNYNSALADIKSIEVISKENAAINKIFDYNCVAIAPLKVHNKTNGYLFAGKKLDNVFDDDELKAIGAFADYAAIALENSKLLAESLEKERLEKELEVAREIQYKILPNKTPEIEYTEISALFIPAFEVGGDYYDFFNLEDGKIAFVIADVSGKGISAAFIMAEIKGIFETLSKMGYPPKEVLIRANEILKRSLDRKNFVTVIYGVLDNTKGILKISRAGHLPILLVRDKCMERLKPGGIGLGLDYSGNFENNIEEVEIKLKENDILVLYTDGIPESKNAQMEDFGEERFEKVILQNSGESINELSNQILKDVTVFSQGNPQHDDITLVIFKWKNKNSGEV